MSESFVKCTYVDNESIGQFWALFCTNFGRFGQKFADFLAFFKAKFDRFLAYFW